MRLLVFFCVFGLFIISAAGQQSGAGLSGKVLDGAGQPVGGVLIQVVSASGYIRTFTTDDRGEFKADVPSGEYLVTARQSAASPAAGPVRVSVSSTEASTVELRLDAAAIRESVTVSADVLQPIDEVSKTVNIIDGQQMRDRADITLADSLRIIPGFRVQQLGGFGRTASIKTRGLRNQDTAILIDGVRLRDAAAITGDASPFLGDITLTSVTRVEVLRGSGSSIYGTNSIGGTVNFVTPEARPGWHGQIGGAAGGLGMGRFRGNVSYATPEGKFGFSAGVSRTAYTKGIDGDDNASNTNFQPRFDLRPTDRTSTSVRFFYSYAKVRLNVNPDTAGVLPFDNSTIIDAIENVNFIPDQDDPDSLQHSRFLSSVISLNHSFSKNVWLDAYYSDLETRRQNDNGLLGPGYQSESTSHNNGGIQTFNASLNFVPRYHHIKGGYEFENEKYRNENLTPSGTEDNWVHVSQSSSTLFLQDVVGLFGGRLQLAGGIRGQWFNLRTPSFSLNNALYSMDAESPDAALTFDGAVSYFFRTSGTKIRAHTGNGYRVPSLYERFGSYFSTFPSPGFTALGDPELRAERSIAFDAGIEQYAFKRRAIFSATYFYTKLIDTIGFGEVAQPDPNGRFFGYYNNKGGAAKGAEFSAELRPASSTDLFASYTFTDSQQRETQVAGSGVLRSLGIPDHQFTLSATQRYKGFWVNLDLVITSSYLAPIFSNSTFNTYVYRFSGSRRADLTAGYEFRFNKERLRLRVFGTVEDLFDDKYFENGFKTVPVNGRLGTSFSF